MKKYRVWFLGSSLHYTVIEAGTMVEAKSIFAKQNGLDFLNAKGFIKASKI